MPAQEKTYRPIASVPLVAEQQRDAMAQKIFSALQIVKVWICVWSQRTRQRRALRWLDDRLLDDIGLTREQVRHEASKPFWEK